MRVHAAGVTKQRCKEYVMKGRTERTTPASEKMFLIVMSEKVLRVAQFSQRTN